MTRSHLAVAAAFACGVLAAPAIPGHAEDLLDRVLATVEGRVITLSDVRTAVRFGLVETGASRDVMTETLDRLIDRLVILAEVERYAPPEPDPDAIRRGVAAFRSRFESEAEIAAALRVAGLDEAALAQWARNDLRIAQYLQEQVRGCGRTDRGRHRELRPRARGRAAAHGPPTGRSRGPAAGARAGRRRASRRGCRRMGAGIAGPGRGEHDAGAAMTRESGSSTCQSRGGAAAAAPACRCTPRG